MIDSLRFVDAVHGLPEQFTAARRHAEAADLSGVPDAGGIANIVVCGMGGSGISGDVLAAVAGPELRIPVVVTKGYEVPGFTGPGTLLFTMSYSGATEETVVAARAAASAGARIVAVSTGGELAEVARAGGHPVVPCPEGLLPRAALGALTVPLFVVLERVGLLPGAGGWLDAAGAQLARRREKCAVAVLAPTNPARELARRIGRTIALVYGGGALGAVAALRWKADINENAKAPAFWNAYPELDHNEICGWGQHGDVTRQVVSLVELRHDFEHPQVARRFGVTRAIVEEALAQVCEVKAEGDGPLAQLLDLMYLGDWTSVYMAVDAGVDPGPIDAIFQLKTQLARPVG